MDLREMDYGLEHPVQDRHLLYILAGSLKQDNKMSVPIKGGELL
jgi:hypothetical protein